MKNSQSGFIGVTVLVFICLIALGFGSYKAYESLKTPEESTLNMEVATSSTIHTSNEVPVIDKKEISPAVTTNIQTQTSISLPKRLHALDSGVTILDSDEINTMNISGLIATYTDTGVKLELSGRTFIDVLDVNNPNSIGKLYEIKDKEALKLYESSNPIFVYLDDENKIYVLESILDKSTQPATTTHKLYVVKEKLELLPHARQTIVICLTKTCTLGSFRTLTY